MKSEFKLHAIALNTRYTPVIMAAVNYIHVCALLCGWRGIIAENAAGIGLIPAVYMLINEWGFGFCWLHKSLVAYSVLVFACINVERWLGFGPTLLPLAHTLVFALGSYLFGTLIKNWKAYERNAKAKFCR